MEETIKQIEQKIFINNPFQKRIFLNMLNSFNYLFKLYRKNLDNSALRANLMRYFCLYFRILDDLIDENNSPNKKHLQYIEKRKEFIEKGYPLNKANELDKLIYEFLKLSLTLNLDFKNDILKLLDCLIFDLKRKSDIKKGNLEFRTKKQFEEAYFHGFFEPSFKIPVCLSSNNPQAYLEKDLENLALMQYSYYNLEGFLGRLKHGMISIPKEDIKKYKISSTSLIHLAQNPSLNADVYRKKGFNNIKFKDVFSPELMDWFNSELNKGLKYLHTYQKSTLLKTKKDIFRDLFISHEHLDEVILKMEMENVAEKYFNKLLKQSK